MSSKKDLPEVQKIMTFLQQIGIKVINRPTSKGYDFKISQLKTIFAVPNSLFPNL